MKTLNLRAARYSLPVSLPCLTLPYITTNIYFIIIFSHPNLINWKWLYIQWENTRRWPCVSWTSIEYRTMKRIVKLKVMMCLLCDRFYRVLYDHCKCQSMSLEINKMTRSYLSDIDSHTYIYVMYVYCFIC